MPLGETPLCDAKRALRLVIELGSKCARERQQREEWPEARQAAGMATPSWLHNYVPTAADHRQRVETTLDLMTDTDQVFDASIAAFSDPYKQLCEKRAAIDDADPERSHWIYDRETGIVDSIVGACLVVAQAEIGRIADLALSAYDRPLEWQERRDIRARCSPRRKTYSLVEAVWSLANLFKHDDEMVDGKVNNTLTKPSQFTLDVAEECGPMDLPLAYSPGRLEGAVRAVLGCSAERGLVPIGAAVDDWRRSVRAEIVADLLK